MAQVQVSKDEAETILKSIAKDKAIAEQKLKAAEPALLAAEAALQVGFFLIKFIYIYFFKLILYNFMKFFRL